MKLFKILVSAFLAGTVFSVSAIAQLENNFSVMSALLFSFCILIMFNLNLRFFDGKVGYIFTEPKRTGKRVLKVIVTLVGNLAGSVLTGLCFSSVYRDVASEVVTARLELSPLTVFIKAAFCGAILFAATHCYHRKDGNTVGSAVALFAASSVILCSFIHAVTDAFFISAAMRFDMDTLIYFILAFSGNAIGAVIFAELYEAKKSGDEKRYGKSHSHSHSHE